MLVIQRIQVRWSKESRGAPGSSRRSLVPTVLPLALPAQRPSLPVLLQSHAFEERHDFEDRGPSTELLTWAELDAVLPELLIRTDRDGGVTVRYDWRAELGAPPRPRSELMALRDTGWLQVVHNGRHGLDPGWFYEQTHLSIGLGEHGQDVFEHRPPIGVLDCRARLW